MGRDGRAGRRARRRRARRATSAPRRRSRYFDERRSTSSRRDCRCPPSQRRRAPAIGEEIAVQNPRARQNEPRVTLFAADPARMRGFGAIDGATAAGSSRISGRARSTSTASRRRAGRAPPATACYCSRRADGRRQLRRARRRRLRRRRHRRTAVLLPLATAPAPARPARPDQVRARLEPRRHDVRRAS